MFIVDSLLLFDKPLGTGAPDRAFAELVAGDAASGSGSPRYRSSSAAFDCIVGAAGDNARSVGDVTRHGRVVDRACAERGRPWPVTPPTVPRDSASGP
jgi:hypothetical protein